MTLAFFFTITLTADVDKLPKAYISGAKNVLATIDEKNAQVNPTAIFAVFWLEFSTPNFFLKILILKYVPQHSVSLMSTNDVKRR